MSSFSVRYDRDSNPPESLTFNLFFENNRLTSATYTSSLLPNVIQRLNTEYVLFNNDTLETQGTSQLFTGVEVNKLSGPLIASCLQALQQNTLVLHVAEGPPFRRSLASSDLLGSQRITSVASLCLSLNRQRVNAAEPPAGSSLNS